MVEKNLDTKLPMHQVILNALERVLNDVESKKWNCPLIEQTDSIKLFVCQYEDRKNFEVTMARLNERVITYLSLFDCSMSKAHLSEVKKRLWGLTWSKHPELISTLKQLEEK